MESWRLVGHGLRVGSYRNVWGEWYGWLWYAEMLEAKEKRTKEGTKE